MIISRNLAANKSQAKMLEEEKQEQQRENDQQ